MKTLLVVVLLAMIWYEGYLTTMRFVSATGGFREAMDVTLTYASRKDYYVGVAIFKVLGLLLWPIVFTVRAIAVSAYEK